MLVAETEANFESLRSRRRKPTYIEWVQTTLNITGAGLDPDGRMGRKTRRAIENFQRSNGLKADGIVGSKTEAALAVLGIPVPGRIDMPGTTVEARRVDIGLNPDAILVEWKSDTKEKINRYFDVYINGLQDFSSAMQNPTLQGSDYNKLSGRLTNLGKNVFSSVMSNVVGSNPGVKLVYGALQKAFLGEFSAPKYNASALRLGRLTRDIASRARDYQRSLDVRLNKSVNDLKTYYLELEAAHPGTYDKKKGVYTGALADFFHDLRRSPQLINERDKNFWMRVFAEDYARNPEGHFVRGMREGGVLYIDLDITKDNGYNVKGDKSWELATRNPSPKAAAHAIELDIERRKGGVATSRLRKVVTLRFDVETFGINDHYRARISFGHNPNKANISPRGTSARSSPKVMREIEKLWNQPAVRNAVIKVKRIHGTNG